MDGILNIYKPSGKTSFDIVKYIKKLTGSLKAGHTGTLDPQAQGVLPVCLGKATRLIRFLLDDKEYRAEITFGISTDTGDGFGRVIKLFDASNLSKKNVEEVLNLFKGKIKQVPPMASAIHYKGKRLYELARQGLVVEREPREVIIYDLRLIDVVDWGTSAPKAYLEISCSAGTYIRTLCSDIGEKLGCGAYMSDLLRTRAGTFILEKAIKLEKVNTLVEKGQLERVLTKMDDVLSHLPAVQVKKSAESAVLSGSRIFPVGIVDFSVSIKSSQYVRLCSNRGLLAIAAVKGDFPDKYYFQPVTVVG